MMLRQFCFILMIFLFIGIVTTANAVTIDTSAGYTVETYDNQPVASDTDSDTGTTGTISSSVDNSSYDLIGNASGDENGNTAALAHWMGGNANFVNVNGIAKWSETFTAETAGAYSWDFTITGGQLGWLSNLGPEDYMANYSISILLDSSEIWFSSATWEASSVYTTSGVDLDGVYNPSSVAPFGFGITGKAYTYGSSDHTVALGDYNIGDNIALSYILSVSTSGTAGETGSWAYIGDPGNLSTGAGITGSLQGGGQQDPIPEPTTMLLFSVGLLGIAGFSRRKKINVDS